MKKLTMYVIATLLAVSTTAVAQTENSIMDNGWQSMSVQWNPSSFSPEKGDSQSFTGLSLQYSKAFSVSRTTPFYIEVGVGLQYSFYSEDVYDDYYDYDDYWVKAKAGYYDYDDDYSAEQNFSMFSLKVPVSIVYKWDIPNSKVSLLPYAGLTVRYNISGNIKYEYGDNSNDLNVFKKSDMGKAWNRLQLGWQLGVNARFSNTFYAGLAYGEDFSEISTKTKINTTTITLGWCF